MSGVFALKFQSFLVTAVAALGWTCTGMEPARAGVAAADLHALSGVWWTQGYSPKLSPIGGGPLPFTKEGRTRYEAIVAGLKAGTVVDRAATLCRPEGMPRAMTSPFPFQIITTPGQITFAHEANRAYRMVRIADSHADPDRWDPSYMGEGIAKWRGDTLDIDSTNFKADKIYLDASGVPASDKLHLVEHIRLIDGGRRLEDLITIQDSVIFTGPWTTRLVFERRDDVRLQTDWVCGERHRDVSSIKGPAAR